MLFSTRSQDIIVEMISKGWGFALAYSEMPSDQYPKEFRWESDFFKRIGKTNLYDNYKPGESIDSPDEAIAQAQYNALNNIKD